MNAARDERALELKVGATILVALALLVTFVLVLGDFSLGSRVRHEVFFQNPGGLSAGAAVKIAGGEVGKIAEMTYLGQSGPVDAVTKRRALIRARIDIDEDASASLRRDARFYVTTKGVLGDPYLEIDPGGAPEPVRPGQAFFGVDPPRLDLFAAEAYRLVAALNSLLDRNASNLDSILGGGAAVMGAVEEMATGDAGTENVGRVTRLMDGLDGLLGETRALVSGAKANYVDNPKVARTIDNLESLTATLDAELPPLLADVREALAIVDRLGATLGPDEQRRIRDALTRLEQIAVRTDSTVGDVQSIIGRIKRGEGTVGQLVADEQIYDDLKELLRDLKQHPWKLMWKD